MGNESGIKLLPPNYARVSLMLIELKCESTNSEAGSPLAQLLSKPASDKKECSHPILVCLMYFSGRGDPCFTPLQVRKLGGKLFQVNLSHKKFQKAFSIDLNFLVISKQKLTTN